MSKYSKVAVLEDQFKNHPELKREDLEKLCEWMRVQPHLPEISGSSNLL